MGTARPSTNRPDLPLNPFQVSQVSSLAGINAGDWDALFDGDSPFVRHAFLSALEQHGCVGESTGWLPRHLLIHHGDRLVGGAPLYLKLHSYGEFVFDFSWAEASHRLRQPYYPKLLNAIPFTPSTGPRLGASNNAVRKLLAEKLVALTQANSLSSSHALFVDESHPEAFGDAGFLERNDIQFHWFNRGDTDFAAFAALFSSDKRKKVLRERRRVTEAGLRFEVRPGEELDEALWAAVYALYANTYEERGQAPYLTPDFLYDYGGRRGSPLRVILCYDGQRLVAAALTLEAGDTLYGRHWGAADRYHSLHFECCYYQGIEWCLRNGLRRYDAGTQGEHKLARGFTPVQVRSFHYLHEPRLADAVRHFLDHERRLVATRQQDLAQHSPYRSQTDSAR